MTVYDHVESVIWPLSQIIVACIPVYFLLVVAEKGLDKLANFLMRFDVADWLYRKLEAAKAREAEIRARMENRNQ